MGFELLEDAYIDQSTGSKRGDSFSFATGSKTFLEHRNSEGQVVGVTYTGSDENSEFYIGKDTKISSFLDAEDGNTAELANVLKSLIELREGLVRTHRLSYLGECNLWKVNLSKEKMRLLIN